MDKQQRSLQPEVDSGLQGQERASTDREDQKASSEQAAAATPPPQAGLTGAFRQFEDLVDAFEAAWSAGKMPVIENYLRLERDAGQELLVELMRCDLRWRLRLGLPGCVELYLRRFPSLAGNRAAVLALVQFEWQLRANQDPSGLAVDFLARFPEFRDQIGLLAAAQAVESDVANTIVETKLALPTPQVGGQTVNVPGYEVLEILGRGGMGIVYKARHIRLNRLVALKMIQPFADVTEDDVRRLLTGAQTVALLAHPNIVKVFECGLVGGKPFLALEYAPRGSLKELSGSKPLSPRQAATIVEAVARGVQHAHDKGIIHRDLKPENVLLMEDSTPRISDLGLARHEKSGGQFTQTGAILGTPPYMAPEQAAGRTKDVGILTDVYGIGALLYHLLTGRPPFQAATVTETLLQVIGEEPVPPRRLNPAVPRDLESVCLRCLDKEPKRRYPTAGYFGDDLRRYLAGQPTHSRPVGALEYGWRWCRRNAVLASLIAAVLVTLVLGAVVGTGLALWALAEKDRADTKADLARQEVDRADKEAKKATAEKERAETERDKAEMSGYVNKITLAPVEWDHGDPVVAWDHLEGCKWNLRGWEHHYLATLFNKTPTFRGHTNAVSSVAFSPDGKRIVSGSGDKTVKIWDADEGTELLSLKGHTNGILSVAFSPDGKRIITGSEDCTVKIWDANKGTETLTLKGHTGPVTSVAFSPDGKRTVSASNDHTVKIWDADKGSETLTLMGHTGSVASVAFSPDGKHIVSDGDNNTVKIWDAAKGTQTLTLMGHRHGVSSVAFSPDGKRIISGSYDCTVKIWDADKGIQTGTLMGHTAPILSVAFSPDGKRIASGSWDNTIKIWDADMGIETRTLKGHKGDIISAILSVAFSPDGKRIVSGSVDNTIKIWDADMGTEARTLNGHTSEVTSVAFSPDGKRIVTGGVDKTVRIWDADKGTETLTLTGHTGHIKGVAFSPDGKRIVSSSEDCTVKIWDADKGTEIRTLKGHTDLVTSVAFSPDGKRIVSGSWDNMVKVWSVDKGTEIRTLKDHTNRVTRVAFSLDGKRIFSCSSDKMVKVVDMDNGERNRLLPVTLQDEKEEENQFPQGAHGLTLDSLAGLHQ